jgi:CDP-2,3-bis-(O-geranylgeranyl)-sn-glycerol synthase
MFSFDPLMIIAYIFPAYASNGAPVLFVRLVKNPHPIDCGAFFIDGRRILGDGKTLEGLVSGLMAGILAGIILSSLPIPLYRSPLEFVLLCVGAMLGDILGSFSKRRFGVPRGGPVPVLDQLGFLILSIVTAWSVMGPPEWVDSSSIIFLFVLTFLLHLGTNAAAYLIGLKDRWY